MEYTPEHYQALCQRYHALGAVKHDREGQRIAAELYQTSKPLGFATLGAFGRALIARDREEIYNSAFATSLAKYDPNHISTNKWSSYFCRCLAFTARALLRTTEFDRQIVNQAQTEIPDDEDTSDNSGVNGVVDPNGTTYELTRHEFERLDRFGRIMESLPPVMAWALRNRFRGVSARALGKVAGVTGEAIRRPMDKYGQYFPLADLPQVDHKALPDSPCPWVKCDACGKQMQIVAHAGICSGCAKW